MANSQEAHRSMVPLALWWFDVEIVLRFDDWYWGASLLELKNCLQKMHTLWYTALELCSRNWIIRKDALKTMNDFICLEFIHIMMCWVEMRFCYSCETLHYIFLYVKGHSSSSTAVYWEFCRIFFEIKAKRLDDGKNFSNEIGNLLTSRNISTQ